MAPPAHRANRTRPLAFFLGIFALLLVQGDVWAVSLSPTDSAPTPSAAKETAYDGLSLWNLLNSWSPSVADNRLAPCAEGRLPATEEQTRTASDENRDSDQERNNEPVRSRLLPALAALLAPGHSTGAGTGTSAPSHAPGSSVALVDKAEDLSPQVVARLACERGSPHPILKPSSIFHPPRR